ncbi:hypothetical protein EV182_004757, partial [Spiromyces aspiralis]
PYYTTPASNGDGQSKKERSVIAARNYNSSTATKGALGMLPGELKQRIARYIVSGCNDISDSYYGNGREGSHIVPGINSQRVRLPEICFASDEWSDLVSRVTHSACTIDIFNTLDLRSKHILYHRYVEHLTLTHSMFTGFEPGSDAHTQFVTTMCARLRECLKMGWSSVKRLTIDMSFIDTELAFGLFKTYMPKLQTLSIIVEPTELPKVFHHIHKNRINIRCITAELLVNSNNAFTIPFKDEDLLHQFEASPDRLTHLSLLNWIVTGPSLLSLQKYQRSLKSLTVFALPNTFHVLNAENPMNITSLTFSCIIVQKSNDELQFTSQSFPLLQELAIDQICTLNGNREFKESTVLLDKVFSKSWPHMKRIKLPYLNDHLAKLIARACPNLQSLEIFDDFDEPRNFHDQNEQHSVVDNSRTLTSQGFLEFVQNLPNLYKLTVGQVFYPEKCRLDSKILWTTEPQVSKTSSRPTLADSNAMEIEEGADEPTSTLLMRPLNWNCTKLGVFDVVYSGLDLFEIGEILKRLPCLRKVTIDLNDPNMAALDTWAKHEGVYQLNIVNQVWGQSLNVITNLLSFFPNVKRVNFHQFPPSRAVMHVLSQMHP